MAKKVRVKIDNNAESILNLANLVAQKHKELGDNSPLKQLDWNVQAENVTKALELHKQAKEYQRLAEQAHEQRNTLLTVIDDLVKQSRDLLKALYRNEPKKLGEFGFNVDDTPKKKAKG
jgi:hypothetical protein